MSAPPGSNGEVAGAPTRGDAWGIASSSRQVVVAPGMRSSRPAHSASPLTTWSRPRSNMTIRTKGTPPVHRARCGALQTGGRRPSQLRLCCLHVPAQPLHLRKRVTRPCGNPHGHGAGHVLVELLAVLRSHPSSSVAANATVMVGTSVVVLFRSPIFTLF